MERLLRIPEVERILDVPLARAYELARLGVLPTVRIGRQVRVAPSLLAAFVAEGGGSAPKNQSEARSDD